jgi:hypothetical protein
MGRVKDIYIAREEYASKLSELLGENVVILEKNSDANPLEWWKFRLSDGVVVSKIDDLAYVEPAPIECGAQDFEEIAEAIASVRTPRITKKEKN